MLANDRPNVTNTGEDSLGRRRSLLSTGTVALKNAIDLTNNYITRNHGRTNMFATVFFGVLDPVTGSLVYINGGQEPPILLDSHGIKQVLKITGCRAFTGPSSGSSR
jgi:sigma-B regulation protein RsbU (phosphoserine phosphatase)